MSKNNQPERVGFYLLFITIINYLLYEEMSDKNEN